MFELDLLINNQGRYPVNGKRLFDVVKKALSQAVSDSGRYEISVLIVGKEEMAEYNLKYHQTGGPTDVLSFPYMDPESQISKESFVTPKDAGLILGDIIVCYPVAEDVAAKEGKPVEEMVEFYILHGLEHLLGNHHE